MAVDLVTKSCEKVARPIFEKVATAVSFATHCNPQLKEIVKVYRINEWVSSGALQDKA
jgi:hypothetical protein